MEYVKGLVSVIIPTYKRSDSLKRCIDSVLNQTYRKLELLLVNDNTVGDEYSKQLYRLLEGYSDERLIFVEQEKHFNGAVARNVGIRRAKGEYIAFNDDDDYWELQKLEHQVKILSGLDESWGAASCLMRIYNGDKLLESMVPYKDGSILLDILDRKTSMGTGALLIRHKALDDVGYFDENLVRHQDLQLFACLTEKYKVKLEKVYLHNREIHDGQNRPDPVRMMEVKKAFFESIEPIMNRLKKSDRKKVLIMHKFELAYHFYKYGDKKDGIRSALAVLQTPATFFLAIHRLIQRGIQKKFRRQLERKYSIKN
ncbi:MAG: glycosyltransferase family 2 protein [Lachnospiraceae bacterium]|nr:glycosyltransferase family 2 protein [Lachnospiraceae bacterium]